MPTWIKWTLVCNLRYRCCELIQIQDEIYTHAYMRQSIYTHMHEAYRRIYDTHILYARIYAYMYTRNRYRLMVCLAHTLQARKTGKETRLRVIVKRLSLKLEPLAFKGDALVMLCLDCTMVKQMRCEYAADANLMRKNQAFEAQSHRFDDTTVRLV